MIGQTVSHYRILEKLGGGGMGVVYRAEDTLLKRTVALKFLPPSFSADPEAKERFTHEAQAASALDHPSICAIHEIGQTDDGQQFIVMACYDGETLKTKIEQGPLDIDRALDIAIQIASGLSRAHEAGIIHRDIKPANVMVTDRGEVKILDFGLAKLSGRTLLTKTGTTLGTAAYMSPEQARGEQVGHQTDIWSLGIVLYEMLTGQRPYLSDYEQALVYSILNEDPKPVRSLRPEIPEVVEQIILKALAKNPEDRYQRADDLLTDLNAARAPEQTGRTIAGSEAVARKRTKTRTRILAATGIALLILIAAFFLVLPLIQDQALANNPRTIAIIGFENLTNDKSLDNVRVVLQEWIISSLDNSKYFHVTNRQRMTDIVKQLGKKEVEYVNHDLGLEICRHEGVQLMAEGTFANVGKTYLTTLKIVDVNTLEQIKTCNASGEGSESLIRQINDLTHELSRGIGVSERRTQETIRPAEETRSSSLEATALYVRGCQEYDRLSWAEARRYLEMAVQKDSQFAIAWHRLAYTAGWLKDEKSSDYALKKAASLAWRASVKDQWEIAKEDSTLRAKLMGIPGVSDSVFERVRSERYPKEKEFLVGYGVSLVVHYRKPDEAIPVLNRALELDPNYAPTLGALGYAYSGKDNSKAMEMFERSAAASPGDPNPYDDMGNLLDGMGRHEEAEAKYKQALAVDPMWCISANTLAGGRFSVEDYEGAFQWMDTSFARGKDFGNRSDVLYYRACVAFWMGRLHEADQYLARRDALFANAGQNPNHAWDWLKIWIACERRQFAQCRQTLELWAKEYLAWDPAGVYRSKELNVEACRGFINLKEGIPDSVTATLARMDSVIAQIPASDTGNAAKDLRRTYRRWINPLRSEWLLSTGRIQEALSERLKGGPRARTSRAYKVGAGLDNWDYVPLPAMVDIMPRAYLALGQIDSSIAAYEKAIELPGPIFPRYHYRLAQVYERKGLRAKAIAEYEKFLKIWGKADPIYKEPADARARLTKLKQSR